MARLTLSHSHPLTLLLFLSHSLTLSLSHSLTLSLSRSLTLTLSHSLTLSLSLSHSLNRSLAHSLNLSRSHSLLQAGINKELQERQRSQSRGGNAIRALAVSEDLNESQGQNLVFYMPYSPDSA